MPSSTSPSSPSSSAAPSPGPRRGVLIGMLVAIAALLLGWLSQFAVDSGGGTGGGSAGDRSAARQESADDAGGSPALQALARRDADDALAMGEADAPVVLIEYADFGCSFCGKFARDTEPRLIREYVDKGVLRIEWRNFPVFGAGSERAARAAWAAGEQGRFWEFHAAAYADESSAKKGFADARLTALAREAGVPDLDRFDRDRDSAAARKALRRDQDEGYGLGATSTPSFLINGRPIAGAQPAEVFEAAIDEAAAAARSQGAGE